MAQAMDRGRLEAFSDGVLAVAITLLVLDLHVDASEGHPSLGHQLRLLWPQISAYVVSFLVIGVIWVNHHALCLLIGTVDRTLLFVNLVLLLFVTTLPFTTSVLADFIGRHGGADARWAAALYGVSNTGMAFAFTAMLHRMVSRTCCCTRCRGMSAPERCGDSGWAASCIRYQRCSVSPGRPWC